MAEARTIDEVVEQLDRIVAAAIAERSRIGLFAALYRQVTLRVRQRIADGFFEDGPRMARFDAVFASRYLDALATWQANGEPSKCWKLALEATRRTDLIILQHLLLGMNAHINLDLGIAAAAVAPGASLAALHTDFDRINQVLSGLVDQVTNVLERFSPMIKLLARVGSSAEDALVNFSMNAARCDAWNHATVLAPLVADQQPPTISLIDDKTTFLGRLVAEPGWTLTAVLRAVHLSESSDLPAIMQALNTIAA